MKNKDTSQEDPLEFHSRSRSASDAPSENELEVLFASLGARESVPKEDLDEIEVATREAWQRQIWLSRAKRRRRSLQVGLLAAAAVVLAAILGGAINQLTKQTSSPQPVVATVEKIKGAVQLRITSEAQNQALAQDKTIAYDLPSGSFLESARDSGAVLRFTNGTSLRLAPSSQVTVEGHDRIALSQGAVYIVTGGTGANQIQVRTPLGVATDIGTRFMVEVGPNSTTVSVRDGKVELASPGEKQFASRGDRLVLDEQGSFSLQPLEVYGETWQWILPLSTNFTREGATLEQYLEWINIETGLEARFADPESRAAFLGVQLHGSFQTSPMQDLEDTLASVGLTSTLDQGLILIEDIQ